MAEESVEEQYLGYKRVVSKLGFEAAQAQYRQQYNQPIELSLLIEFHYLQHEIHQYRNDPDRATMSIRAGVQFLSKDAFIHDHAQGIVRTLDWFDTIESENEEQYEGLQSVYEGFIHLPTRCELVRYVVRHDPLGFDTLVDDLIQIAGCLNSRCLIQLSEMIISVVEEKPICAALVRHNLVERQLLPEIVTRLTVLYCQDEMEFLNSVFYRMPSWFIAQSGNSVQYFMKMKERLFGAIGKCAHETSFNSVQLDIALRALVGLVGFFGIKLAYDEVTLCLTILRETRTERLVKLILCLALINAEAFLRQQKALDTALDQLLESKISDMPIKLIAYFRTDQISAVEDTIRSVLDMQIPIPKLGLFEMQKLISNRVIRS